MKPYPADSRVVQFRTWTQAQREEVDTKRLVDEAEKDLLWSILNRPLQTIPLVRNFKPQDFTGQPAALVFRNIRQMIDEGRPIGLLELIQHMEDNGTLHQLPATPGGHPDEWLTSLQRKGYVHDVAGVVRRFRRIAAAGSAAPAIEALLQNLKHRRGGSVEHTLAAAEQAIVEFKASFPTASHIALPEGAAQIFESWEVDRLSFRAIRTCFERFNQDVGGIAAPGLVLLAGNTGAGKSTAAVNIANGLAETEPSLFIGFEMSEVENVARVLSIRTGIPEDRILSGNLELRDKRRLYELPLQTGLEFWGRSAKLNDVEAIITERAAAGVRVVFLDALKHLKIPGPPRKQHEIVELGAVRLAALAKSLEICIVALCHLKVNIDFDEEPSANWIYGAHAADEATQVLILFQADKDDPDRHLCVVKGRRGSQRFRTVLRKVGQSSKVVEA